MKKCLLWLAVASLIACFSAPIAVADEPAPNCGPDGCTKPGVRVFLPGTADEPAPNCGPDGCTKPGVVLPG